jgi:hypothetical protein
MEDLLEKYAIFLEDYANFLKNNKPIIDIPLSSHELLEEASRIRAKSRVKGENGIITVRLNEGNPEHWAHFEGEIIMTFDKLYRPLKLEIEIKDMMGSEKVLKKLGDQKFSDIKYENEVIEIVLANGEPEHWAHFEGEIVMVLDRLHRPLKLEIEIKDIMDSEKVLINANLLSTS